MEDNTIRERFFGCFLGGVLGDAISANDLKKGQILSFTANTQMMLFSSEGLILSKVRPEYQKDNGIILSIYNALLRWLFTQQTELQSSLIQSHGTCSIIDGVLTGYTDMFSVRPNGQVSFLALKSNKIGTLDDPVNQNNGPDVMFRVMPIGLAFKDAQKAFQVGCESAALTHGAKNACLSAGTFAFLISLLLSDCSLVKAVEESFRILKTKKDHKEILNTIGKILDSFENKVVESKDMEKAFTYLSAENVLAESIFAAMIYEDDFKQGVLLNSTVSCITGSLMGALQGQKALPSDWLAGLELKTLVEETAKDLYDQFR